jgi:O-antigen/teichoic acid export membrane protein
MRTLVLMGSLLSVLSTTPVAIVVMVLATPFVHVWVGGEYEHAAVYIQIFLAQWLIGSNTGALSSAVMGLGRMRTFVVITVATAFANLALKLVLLPTLGVVGVFWATVIVVAVQIPIWMYFALRHVGIPVSVYVRGVVVPAYGLIAGWAAIAVPAAAVLEPSGVVGAAAFGTAALGLFGAMAFPLVRARWRAADRGEDTLPPFPRPGRSRRPVSV